MKAAIHIGLVGDHDASVPAHRAIPLALRRAGDVCGVAVEGEWVPTDEITSSSRISRFDGLCCVPASPYRSMEGRLPPIVAAFVQAGKSLR
jgi:CTP synthase (UTP-ammonia lyase)